MDDNRTYGWHSSFEEFCAANPLMIRNALETFVSERSQTQISAWDQSISILQSQQKQLIQDDPNAGGYHDILEYQLPMESRRPDAVLLSNGSVMVAEFKGKRYPTLADIDQVAAYARDLRSYHRECSSRPIIPVLIPILRQEAMEQQNGVFIIRPEELHILHRMILTEVKAEPIEPEVFLNYNAYTPLPTLVQAARELFESRQIREVWRARAATDPAVVRAIELCRQSASQRKRRLILITGVPGSGKTLVGLRIVHERSLDDLAIVRDRGRPTAPAVFLSGNAPLVKVLQYALGKGTGNGKTFVRGVKDYVKYHARSDKVIPNEHVIVFDEAQRAWDAERVAEKHDYTKWGATEAKSEPEYFVDFAQKVPEWCVLVGLIGSGQEIHVGEEGGIIQWRHAIEQCTRPEDWTVHAPRQLSEVFEDSGLAFEPDDTLNLDTEIRYHLVPKLHEFVDGLLTNASMERCKGIADELFANGMIMYITRNQQAAMDYVRERYTGNSEARYGLVASSRDKDLVKYGINNDYKSTLKIDLGPWYYDGVGSSKSCCNLGSTVTEFQIQGLELDMVILCWGTDLIWMDSNWSIERAKGFKRGSGVKDPRQLRLNAYRVLLTRGRDGAVIFVPPDPLLDNTFNRLIECGYRILIEY